MPSHAELATRLLNDAAKFFLSLGEQNPPLMEQMQENASVFEQMSQILTAEPMGEIGGTPNAELAGKLLRDAAVFFTTLGNQNASVQPQMMTNAEVFRSIADLLIKNPLGVLD